MSTRALCLAALAALVGALHPAPAAALTMDDAARKLLAELRAGKDVGKVLFRDDFSSGSLNNWKADPGWTLVARPDGQGHCARVVASDKPGDIQDLILAKHIPIVPGHPIAAVFKTRFVKGAMPMFLRVDFFDDKGKQGQPYARQDHVAEANGWTQNAVMISDWFPPYTRATTVWFHQAPKSATTALLADVRVVDLYGAAEDMIKNQLPDLVKSLHALEADAARLPKSRLNDAWAAAIRAWVATANKRLPGLEELAPASHELEVAVTGMQTYVSRFNDALAGLRAKSLTSSGALIYRTTPISGTKILPTSQALPGKLATGADLTACRGEYEPASFVLWSPTAISGLTLTPTDLRGPAGTIPASAVDVRWVKCWFQAGTAWTGVAQDRSHKVLVPELLLRDDSLVRVDLAGQHTFLRLDFPTGAEYVPIDSPTPQPWGTGPKVQDFPVHDARTLQPANLPAGQNQQIWADIHVPADAQPGKYTGEIRLSSGGKQLGALRLTMTVLPFDLPAQQRTHYDPSLPFTYSLYYWGYMDGSGQGTISNHIKDEVQFRGELQALWDHGIVAPCMILPASIVYGNEPLFRKHLEIMREIGMSGRPLYFGSSDMIGAPTDQAGLDKLRRNVTKTVAIAHEYGFTDVYFYGLDEARGEKLKAERKAWPVVHEAGGKVIVSGFQGQFQAVGDLLDLFNYAGPPDLSLPKLWHSVGHRLWNYADPQTPPEDPELYRRNYGLFLWKIDWDGENTYCFMDSGWDDFADNSFRGHMLAYPTTDGCVPTLAFDGLREATYDTKYATLLAREIAKAKTGNARARDAAAAAQKWLDALNPKTCDLDAARATMIQHILAIAEAR